MQTQKIARILLLDDESDFVDACAFTLKRKYHVVKTSSPFEAISLLDASRMMVDLVICDFHMPGMNGLEFLQELKKIKVKVPVVLFTGAPINAADQRYADFVKIIEKPFDGENLLSVVAALLQEEQLSPVPSIVLDPALASLESYLKGHGVEALDQLDPDSSLKHHGRGEIHSCFLAWYHLNALKSL